ncbi:MULTISPECIES: hypothetical protein [Colwellia]|uniref:Swiss Army Knife 2H phosphoesterase domain-containing protein n=1 Tax=Colwellia marinimaniae TaxID=1513592 RepID=A0ABQ0MUT8_9GAMM|nr:MULTISPECIES: hypothetical protein [Colwellia]GAW96120.1 hypothetical protein MTCD1_01730 [Colwellia marinimaniae]
MQKINNITSLKAILCTIALFWQTSLFAHTITEHAMENTEHKIEQTQLTELGAAVKEAVKEPTVKSIQIELVKLTDKQLTELGEVVKEAAKEPTVKSIQIELVKLTDNSGLSYIGGKVNAADLDVYLFQMKQILGDDFTLYRQYQSKRDHHTFHMTLINPYEYQNLCKRIAIGTKLSVSLRGLARVSVDHKTAYFVVAQSAQAKSYRQSLVLTAKDFHITLGFYPNDVYGVNKGIETLIPTVRITNK